MTQDEIVEMARQAGFFINDELTITSPFIEDICISPMLKEFAKLVDAKATAKEREECADLVENFEYQDKTGRHDVFFLLPHEHVAKAIRARNID